MQHVSFEFFQKVAQVIEVAQFDAPLAERASENNGGFVWWYADLTNAVGDGCVLVWSLGLPFLPGSRERPVAAERPSVHFAMYRGGRPELYLLNRHAPEELELNLSTGSGVIGRSRFQVESVAGQKELIATLDEPIPGSSERLKCTLQLNGAEPGSLGGSGTGTRHVWAPQVVHGTGSLTSDTDSIAGGAYFDSNASVDPLHDQGLGSWKWGRLQFPNHSLVYYEISALNGKTESLLYRQDESGFRPYAHKVEFSGEKRSTYGIRSPRRVDVSDGTTITADHLVDDGPFYQRFLASATNHCGEVGYGVAEVVLPGRVDLPWQRPFVRMKEQVTSGGNSMWLPLFSGPQTSRVSRFLRGMLER